jgi:hypothetical protein
MGEVLSIRSLIEKIDDLKAAIEVLDLELQWINAIDVDQLTIDQDIHLSEYELEVVQFKKYLLTQWLISIQLLRRRRFGNYLFFNALILSTIILI